MDRLDMALEYSSNICNMHEMQPEEYNSAQEQLNSYRLYDYPDWTVATDNNSKSVKFSETAETYIAELEEAISKGEEVHYLTLDVYYDKTVLESLIRSWCSSTYMGKQMDTSCYRIDVPSLRIDKSYEHVMSVLKDIGFC